MTKILLCLLTGASLLAFSSSASAGAAERVYKPHSSVNDPTLVMQVRQEMSRLEGGFVEIEPHNTAGQVDYDKILKAVENMEAAARTIQRVIANKEWSPLLKDLNSQLQSVRRSSNRQDPITLRKNIDAMYDACFHCHASNAPKYDKD